MIRSLSVESLQWERHRSRQSPVTSSPQACKKYVRFSDYPKHSPICVNRVLFITGMRGIQRYLITTTPAQTNQIRETTAVQTENGSVRGHPCAASKRHHYSSHSVRPPGADGLVIQLLRPMAPADGAASAKVISIGISVVFFADPMVE